MEIELNKEENWFRLGKADFTTAIICGATLLLLIVIVVVVVVIIVVIVLVVLVVVAVAQLSAVCFNSLKNH